MFTLFRWMIRLTYALIALALILGGAVWYFAARSRVDYSATWQVSGITAPVELVRDTGGVPHIFGATDADVYFALGFAHAQDRLWQMTVLRRTVQGRLSEQFGTRTLKTDELMRRLDLAGAAEASLAAQDAETRAALEAYSKGVNAWIKTVNDNALGRGAPEFWLFDAEIPYWQPADSLAILKLMAVQLSDNLQREVLRARLSTLSPKWAADLMPVPPGPALGVLPPYASLAPGAPASAPAQTPPAQTTPPQPAPDDRSGALSPFPALGLSGASNAFAAAPGRSASGGALLANDPHLPLAAPALWYLARLELKSGGVIGATIPGIPAVLSGRSNRLGWGITAASADDQDLFLEELNPADPERYRTPTGWAPFTARREIITVRDAEPVTVTLRWTENGAVLPGSHFNLADVTPPGMVVALNWTAFSRNDASMTAALHLMQAQSRAEAISAAQGFSAPALNLTLADATGIGMTTIGDLPARTPMHETRGMMPSPGWKPENRWQGLQPFARHPQVSDPPGGILGNTNNKTTDAAFPDHVSFDWADSQRIQRFTRLMGAREVHTRESFIAAQLDTVSPAARTLLPLIGKELWFTGTPSAEGTPERLRERALELLAAWDGDMNEHLPEPLIYAAWLRELQHRLVRDELGPLGDEVWRIEPLFLERVYTNTEGAAAWCDVIQSAPVETCTDLARQSLDAALIDLVARYGPALESWRWGTAHEARQDHPVLGDVPILRWFVNIRQSTSGGDFTLNRGVTAATEPDPFLNVHAAGYRGVYDFADPDSSVFIIATGQSGHPLSRFYDDQSVLWRRGEYLPMSLDPALARAAAAGVMHLEPATE